MSESLVIGYPHHMDLSGHRIGSLGEPTGPTEAATKNYVDTAIGTPLTAAAAIHAATVRSAAGVPSGAPSGTELPIALDTTAVTGGTYLWTGAAWVKVA